MNLRASLKKGDKMEYDGSYLEELKARVMALGIEDDYIDQDKIFFVSGGHLCLDLVNFICSQDMDVYKIPNEVYGLFIDNSTIYRLRKLSHKITVVTDKNLMSVCSSKDFVSNEIKLVLGDLRCLDESFQNITFDFRKSIHLNSIAAGSFRGCTVDNLYFGNGLTTVGYNAFSSARMNEVSFANVQAILQSGFYGAIIQKLTLSESITSIGYNALNLRDSILDECVCLSDDVGYTAFRNIKNIYLPYDIYDYNIDMANKLSKIADDLKHYKTTYRTAYLELKKYFESDFDGQLDIESSSDISMLIECFNTYDMYLHGEKELHDFISNADELISMSEYPEMKSNVYFYLSRYLPSRYDVHDREYKFLASSACANYYIEEEDVGSL
jgi:hypothetical protein